MTTSNQHKTPTMIEAKIQRVVRYTHYKPGSPGVAKCVFKARYDKPPTPWTKFPDGKLVLRVYYRGYTSPYNFLLHKDGGTEVMPSTFAPSRGLVDYVRANGRALASHAEPQRLPARVAERVLAEDCREYEMDPKGPESHDEKLARLVAAVGY